MGLSGIQPMVADPAVFDPVTGISALAKMYINPVIITGSAHFKARVLYNGIMERFK